ncbi:MAG TPA: hypothetical protein VME20_10645 [Acidimicrobiales bacterium]|nr:hypothetical protein [Acidimicrobiales bacterium]
MPWPAEIARLPARHLRALVSCNAVSDELPLVVDGSRRPSPAMEEHLRTCLRCQAELAGYRRLLRALKSLKEEPVAFPAPALVGEALRVVQEHLASFGGAASGSSAARSRSGAHWWVAGSVAAVGVVALLAGANAARVNRQNRALVAL